MDTFLGIFCPIFCTSIFTTNRIATIPYTVFGVNGGIHYIPRLTRYCRRKLHFRRGRSGPGHPPSLSVRASGFVFPRNTWCPQILCVCTRLEQVSHLLYSIFANSLSVVSVGLDAHPKVCRIILTSTQRGWVCKYHPPLEPCFTIPAGEDPEATRGQGFKHGLRRPPNSPKHAHEIDSPNGNRGRLPRLTRAEAKLSSLPFYCSFGGQTPTSPTKYIHF